MARDSRSAKAFGRDFEHFGNLRVTETLEDEDDDLALRERQAASRLEQHFALVGLDRAFLGVGIVGLELLGQFGDGRLADLLGDEGDRPILGDAGDERLQRRIRAIAGQGLPDREEDLLGQIFAQAGIGFVGGGDTRDQRAIIGDDTLERRRRAAEATLRRMFRRSLNQLHRPPPVIFFCVHHNPASSRSPALVTPQ